MTLKLTKYIVWVVKTKQVKDVQPSWVYSKTYVRDDNCDLHGIPGYFICEKHRNNVVVDGGAIYTTGKKYGISEKKNGSTRIWYFDLLEIAWRQPQKVLWLQCNYRVLCYG